ncbi:MFS transporter [Actibacterium pelagium]|uniref:MFS transporter n=1 Tax=Actibacterium pelagium TaxID=2029103 RepID=A0A917EM90_9RHOB|nr:MFS transporter [Actibacterium pelagium]GGE59845.1 MFS transporter [Actibacterium pelagium]
MRMLIAFTALFMSTVLLQLSINATGPLDALSGVALGFTRGEIGLLGSAHFFGFFAGCWWAPRLMGSVGHARAFAAFTATGAISLLAHMMITDPIAWAVMRMATGLCIAGCATIIESWLQARTTNETRGRTTSVYLAVDMGGAMAAQLMISILTPATYVAYNLLAIICCAALLPLALTKVEQPLVPKLLRLRPMLAIRRSPLAAAGVAVAGLASAAFRMVGPLYGQEVGLQLDQIALFMAAFFLGGIVAQYPVGWLADRYDRRIVLIGLSGAAIASAVACVILPSLGATAIILGIAVFGLTTFPLYSISAAHAHDFAKTEERAELTAALMFLFAVGAIGSPLLAAKLIDWFGPNALFWMISTGHILLIIFGLSRMRVRPTLKKRTRFVYAPRTSFTIGRLMKATRERKTTPQA